jgi:hypothetical protein|nr:MAG TPA: hypothetical protein [Caudoviricetes sp.]
MGKNKSANTDSKYVSLGDNAYSFYDPSTGIQVVRGEVVELSLRQLAAPKIRKALINGHLQYVADKNEVVNEVDPDTLKAKFDKLVEAGMDAGKIAKAFTMEEAKTLAEDNNITVEEGDTVLSIVEALMS